MAHLLPTAGLRSTLELSMDATDFIIAEIDDKGLPTVRSMHADPNNYERCDSDESLWLSSPPRWC